MGSGTIIKWYSLTSFPDIHFIHLIVFQVPKGFVQKVADKLTKISLHSKQEAAPLCDQMKQKIRKEKLILPHEKF